MIYLYGGDIESESTTFSVVDCSNNTSTVVVGYNETYILNCHKTVSIISGSGSYEKNEFCICITATPTKTPTPTVTPTLTPTITITPSQTQLPLSLTENTEINIWFDNSGSMFDTLSPLENMRDNLLQPCLLPIYNNDVSLYNERVKVLNMGSLAAERFISCFSVPRNYNRTTDSSVNLVINLVFQDESSPYGVGSSSPIIPEPPNVIYTGDVSTLRTNIITYLPDYDIKGVIYQVNTGPGSYPGFRNLVLATFVNTGTYTPPKNISDLLGQFVYQLDITEGSTPNYYLSLVQSGLNSLGVTIPTC